MFAERSRFKHLALQNMKFLDFFLFWGFIIRPSVLGSDRIQPTKIYVDPDPQHCFWVKKNMTKTVFAESSTVDYILTINAGGSYGAAVAEAGRGGGRPYTTSTVFLYSYYRILLDFYYGDFSSFFWSGRRYSRCLLSSKAMPNYRYLK